MPFRSDPSRHDSEVIKLEIQISFLLPVVSRHHSASALLLCSFAAVVGAVPLEGGLLVELRACTNFKHIRILSDWSGGWGPGQTELMCWYAEVVSIWCLFFFFKFLCVNAYCHKEGSLKNASRGAPAVEYCLILLKF